MKKILLILSLFPILVFSQKSYKIPADSTILNNIGSGKNELVIRNATSNITGGVLTNLGNGVTAFVLGGNSARVVDTIYKNSAKDSIVFAILGIRYAVKDSIGVTDLSGYVPYIGATGDVNIGLHKYIGTALQSNISAGVLILNNTASPIGLFGAGGGINSTFYGAVKLDGGTANRILSLDASKNIQYTVIQKVDSSYLFKNATRDSICMITIINGNTYRSCAFDSVGGGGDVTQSTLNDTASALNSRISAKQNTITTGTTAQYFRGDLSLATFPTNNTSFTNGAGYTTASSTTTFTNKRITARVDSTTSSATPTINTDNVDTYKLTAQSVDITSFTTNLSGTPTDDQILHIVIIGTATRAIIWGSKFEASTVALPTTTVGANRLDVYFIFNTATSKWRCGGVW